MDCWVAINSSPNIAEFSLAAFVVFRNLNERKTVMYVDGLRRRRQAVPGLRRAEHRWLLGH